MGRIMENIRYLGYCLTLESIKHFLELIKRFGWIKTIKMQILGRKFHKKMRDVIYGRKTFKNDKKHYKYTHSLMTKFANDCDKIKGTK